MADEANCSVVLELLQVAFLGKCGDQGLGPWGWAFSFLLDIDEDCCENSGYWFSFCMDWCC